MPIRKKKHPATLTNDPPSLDALLAAKAATDPHAWEAMLNLNKMRSSQRQKEPPAALMTLKRDRK